MTRRPIAALLLLSFFPGLALADSIQDRIEAHRAKEQQIQAALHDKKTQFTQRPSASSTCRVNCNRPTPRSRT